MIDFEYAPPSIQVGLAASRFTDPQFELYVREDLEDFSDLF